MACSSDQPDILTAKTTYLRVLSASINAVTMTCLDRLETIDRWPLRLMDIFCLDDLVHRKAFKLIIVGSNPVAYINRVNYFSNTISLLVLDLWGKATDDTSCGEDASEKLYGDRNSSCWIFVVEDLP